MPPTATHAESLLRAICEDPADTSLRLVYADALEERDAPGNAARSEFVRLQCRLATVPPEPEPCHPALVDGRPTREHAHFCDFCKWHEEFSWSRPLRRREEQLWFSLSSQYFLDLAPQKPLIPCLARGQYKPPYGLVRRGFVAEVTLPTADLLRHGPALALACPLEGVRLSDREPRGLSGSVGVFAYYWDDPENPPEVPVRHRIPPEIHERMPSGDTLGFSSHTIYSTREKADAALSKGCLAWVRSQAGLPPLPA